MGFDKLGFHLPSLIVYIVNFVLLLVILYFFAYKRLLAMMDRRSERIRDGLEAADRAREEASHSQQQMEEKMAESRRESQRLLEQARETAERFRQEEQARAKEEVERFIAAAREDIQRERDRAVQEVRRHFAGLAISAAEKVVRRSIDEEAHRELIEDGRNGILVPKKDPQAIAGAIDRLVSDRELYDSLSNQAEHYIRTNHSAEIAAREYEKLYGKLMSET